MTSLKYALNYEQVNSHLLQNWLPRKCMEWWFSYFSWPIFEFGKATCIDSQIHLTSSPDMTLLLMHDVSPVVVLAVVWEILPFKSCWCKYASNYCICNKPNDTYMCQRQMHIQTAFLVVCHKLSPLTSWQQTMQCFNPLSTKDVFSRCKNACW